MLQSPSLPAVQTTQFEVVHRRSYSLFRTRRFFRLRGGTLTIATTFSKPDLFRHFLIVALTSSEINGNTKGIFPSIEVLPCLRITPPEGALLVVGKLR
ncbi:unnamed protein product [Haemonchus placei]|uniref:Uncharacterized protein n=1 Tax=Haemonchus placei TaxID=6290 RepID=A0A0N4VX49_HAEPC|nr:unnamed protein product [Haemonchus placei]